MLLCLSCGGRTEKPESIETRAYQLKVDKKTGTNRMQPSSAQGEAKIGETRYHYSIRRTPSDSLKKVKDEQGDWFVDNVIELTIKGKGGKTIVDKRFTKQAFAEQVDKNFLSRAILEGLAFDQVKDGRLLFAASVCFPQTDLFVPLNVSISPGGSISITRRTMQEEEIPSTNDAPTVQ